MMPVIQTQDELARGGRPVGDVRKALLDAAIALATQEQAPTLQELAQRACVGIKAARVTVSNLKRCGALAIVRERRVAYRNRRVAEYGLPTGTPVQQGFDFSSLTRIW